MQRNVIRSLVLSLACGSLAVAGSALAQTTQPSGDAKQEKQQQQAQTAAPQDQPQPPRGERRFGEGRMRGEGRGDFRGDGRGGYDNAPRGGGADGAAPGAPGEPNAGPGPDQNEGRPGPFGANSAEEWDKAMAFMKEHSPKRFAMLAELPEDFQQNIKDRMFMRFRTMERLRNTDKDMYDIALRRVGLEDELWTTRWNVRFKGQTLTPEDLSKLREKVAALVDVNLEERELRVQRLRDILKREEEFLTRDKAQREPTISDNVTIIERGERGGIISGMGGGGGGPGGPGGPGGGFGGPRPGGAPTGAPPPPTPSRAAP
jgi:hypothetical protein